MTSCDLLLGTPLWFGQEGLYGPSFQHKWPGRLWGPSGRAPFSDEGGFGEGEAPFDEAFVNFKGAGRLQRDFSFGRGGLKGAWRGLQGGLKGASRGLGAWRWLHLRKAARGLQGGLKEAWRRLEAFSAEGGLQGGLKGAWRGLHFEKAWKGLDTQWTASVHTLHMPKPNVTHVQVLRNGLPRYILYTCPNLM